MEVISLGKTELPLDIIGDYVQSLALIYTPESYDLFLHNCNHFTQDLAVFLVGRGIPTHIRDLPQKFLDTPVGQMMRGQLDRSMRSITQDPGLDQSINNDTKIPSSNRAPAGSSSPGAALAENAGKDGAVYNVTGVEELEMLLASAKKTCAVIFFTMSTCPPCKILYPAYDELAAEIGSKAVFIKVDIQKATTVNAKYQITATPTFMTFLHGEREREWKGVDEATLRGNVKLLVQMAWPPHPHATLKLPSLQRPFTEPVTFRKAPPLEKVSAKMGAFAENPSVKAVISYVREREESGPIESPLPNLSEFSEILVTNFAGLSDDTRFAVVDLVRIATADWRISAYLAVERDHQIISTILAPADEDPSHAYKLQIVRLQFACNLFTSPLVIDHLAPTSSPNLLRAALELLATSSLLMQNSKLRFLASALVYNMGRLDHNYRLEGKPEGIKLSAMESLEAALIEAVVTERESQETLHGLLLALGMLLYSADLQGSTWELCEAMGVRVALLERSKSPPFQNEPLLKEVGEVLLGSSRTTVE